MRLLPGKLFRFHDLNAIVDRRNRQTIYRTAGLAGMAQLYSAERVLAGLDSLIIIVHKMKLKKVWWRFGSMNFGDKKKRPHRRKINQLMPQFSFQWIYELNYLCFHPVALKLEEILTQTSILIFV